MVLQGHHIPEKYFPHYYAPLLPSWCLQTLISRLVLVKRLSLQNVRLRGKKRGLGSLSINSTFRQINCSLFFFLRSTSQPVIITHLFPHHCGILSSSAPPPSPGNGCNCILGQLQSHSGRGLLPITGDEFKSCVTELNNWLRLFPGCMFGLVVAAVAVSPEMRPREAGAGKEEK